MAALLRRQRSPHRHAAGHDDDFTVRLANLLLTPNAELWCPTLEQQEERWWSVFGETIEAGRRANQALNGTRVRYEHHAVRQAKERADVAVVR